jgi:hypothetical protein
MHDLSGLLKAHPFPTALERILCSFARQPDQQTCGASAIRHGLLLGGLTIPASGLEAVLDIRSHEGTSPEVLRTCIGRLGLEAVSLEPPRHSTSAFLDGLKPEFDHGAFLLPCIYAGGHWVCVGAWLDRRVGLVDSFFGARAAALWPDLPRGLGFFTLAPDELDALDWAHHVTLVRPGRWRAQYRAWLPARPALLRLAPPGAPTGSVSLAQAIRVAVHQYLDDVNCRYRELNLHLPDGAAVAIESADPGDDALGVEVLGRGRDEVVVLRRLAGLAAGRTTPPELVVRTAVLGAAQLSTGSRQVILRRTPAHKVCS